MIASFYVSAGTMFICLPSSRLLATTRFFEIFQPKFLIFFPIHDSQFIFSSFFFYRFVWTCPLAIFAHVIRIELDSWTVSRVSRVELYNKHFAVCSMSIKFSAFNRFTLTAISITTTATMATAAAAVALNACTQCVFNSTF